MIASVTGTAQHVGLDRVVVERRVLGQHAVELGERAAHQRDLGLQALRGEVGQPVVTGAHAELGGQDRVELRGGGDVGVGHLAGGRGGGRGGHRSLSSRADMVGVRGASPTARSTAYISAPSTMP